MERAICTDFISLSLSQGQKTVNVSRRPAVCHRVLCTNKYPFTITAVCTLDYSSAFDMQTTA